MTVAVTTDNFKLKELNPAFLAWIIWGLSTAFYFTEYLVRVAPGVMAHQLQQEFILTGSGLGALSAFFYYPYISMQLPVGLLVDRFSIRNLLCLMSFLTAVGCVLSGMASNFSVALFARGLVGFCASFAFISALRLGANWFPPTKLGLIAGFTQAAGMLGAASGEVPVRYLVDNIGWRHTFFCLGILFVILAVLIYLLIVDSPDNGIKQKNIVKKESALSSLKIILARRQTWLNALFAGLVYAPIPVIGEFWGPSYFQYGLGFSAHQASFATGLIFIGWGVGGPIAGWISDKIGRRKPLMFVSSFSGLLIVSILLFTPMHSITELYSLMFLLGMTNFGVSIAYAISTEITPRSTVGTSIAFTNMASIAIGAILQQIVGNLLDFYHAGTGGVHDIALLHANDFSQAMQALPLFCLFGFIMAFMINETWCKSTD